EPVAARGGNAIRNCREIRCGDGRFRKPSPDVVLDPESRREFLRLHTDLENITSNADDVDVVDVAKAVDDGILATVRLKTPLDGLIARQLLIDARSQGRENVHSLRAGDSE